MNPPTLVIDAATAACSVALIADDRVVAAAHEVVGRGHAERLIPMIASLPGGGRADRILVDVGPGSFTGVRVGIAAARGLAFGWGVPVEGYSCLALVAAATFARHDRDALTVVMEGGHGELFVQPFARGGLATASLVSLSPAAARTAVGDGFAVGSGVGALTVLDPTVTGESALPDARDAVLLCGPHLPATPLYGRAPDAKLPGGKTA